MPDVVVNTQALAADGVTVILNPAGPGAWKVDEALDFIRRATGHAPYLWQIPDGSVVAGTSERPLTDNPRDIEPALPYLASTRKVISTWVCMVRHSGFHNGPGCTPDEPHRGTMTCGWKFHLLVDAPGPAEYMTIGMGDEACRS